jgi:hypothetical protein
VKSIAKKHNPDNAPHIIVEGETKANLMRADLKRSGLTEDDARKVGLLVSVNGVASYKAKTTDPASDE